MLMLSRVGDTRFVSNTTTMFASGSHQTLVPVNPRWPKAQAPKRGPADDAAAALPSNPMRSEPPGRGRVSSPTWAAVSHSERRPASASSTARAKLATPRAGVARQA